MVTQQYLVGEVSALVGGLCRDGGDPLAPTVSDLRRRIEQAPLSGLKPLVREAFDVANALCWRSLDDGDVYAFRHESAEAAALREFAECADLMP